MLIPLVTAAHAAPTPYRFVSVHSEPTPLNVFTASITAGSINNHGVMAVNLDGVIYRVDWPGWTPVVEGGMSKMDINDNNQIGGLTNTEVLRLEPDGTVVTLISANFECAEPGDFCGLQPSVLGDALNNAGQITTTASFNDGAAVFGVIWLFGDGGAIEIARHDTVNPGGLFNFTNPAVNDLGIVAFGANEVDDPDGGFASVYSGTGGAVIEEGTPPYPNGGQIQQVIVNESGVMGVNAGGGIHTIAGGIVTTLVTAGGPQHNSFSFNDLGRFALWGEISGVAGIYTGGDLVDDAVLKSGDMLLGGVVTDGILSFRFEENGLSNDGDIVFKVQIDVDGEVESHLIRAIALLPEYDSDDDGVGNDVDNCLTIQNPDQFDTNDDGYGNMCDPDLNDDGFVNFLDVGLIKKVFFTADADADLDGNGSVNFSDLAIMKKFVFKPPGPSAEVQP